MTNVASTTEWVVTVVGGRVDNPDHSEFVVVGHNIVEAAFQAEVRLRETGSNGFIIDSISIMP